MKQKMLIGRYGTFYNMERHSIQPKSTTGNLTKQFPVDFLRDWGTHIGMLMDYIELSFDILQLIRSLRGYLSFPSG